MSGYGYRPYVPVARRRQRAAQKLAKLRRAGREVSPVTIEGRKIARTFWGSAWCENLEAYSDYANRLPRGRTYVRNGSVIDLQITRGRISALVSGSDFYQVELRVERLSARSWKRIRSRCAGQIDSLVELLQGRLSGAVMSSVSRRGEGLFPTPREISLDCSCPDWAVMCKHVAAVLYGVGARLDHAPEMLFALRGVDPAEMVADAVGSAVPKRKAARGRVLAAGDLSSVFGVDIASGGAGAEGGAKAARHRRSGAGKTGAKKRGRSRAKAAEGAGGEVAVSEKAGKKGAAVRKKAAAVRAGGQGVKKRSSRRKPSR